LLAVGFGFGSNVQCMGSFLDKLFPTFASIAVPGLLQLLVGLVLDVLGLVSHLLLEVIDLLLGMFHLVVRLVVQASALLLEHLFLRLFLLLADNGHLQVMEALSDRGSIPLALLCLRSRTGVHGVGSFLHELFVTLGSITISGLLQLFVGLVLSLLSLLANLLSSFIDLLLEVVHLVGGLVVQARSFFLQHLFLCFFLLLAPEDGTLQVVQTLRNGRSLLLLAVGFGFGSNVQCMGSFLDKLFPTFASIAVPGLLQLLVGLVLDVLGLVSHLLLEVIDLLLGMFHLVVRLVVQASALLLEHLFLRLFLLLADNGHLQVMEALSDRGSIQLALLLLRSWTGVQSVSSFLHELFAALTTVTVSGLLQLLVGLVLHLLDLVHCLLF